MYTCVFFFCTFGAGAQSEAYYECLVGWDGGNATGPPQLRKGMLTSMYGAPDGTFKP